MKKDRNMKSNLIKKISDKKSGWLEDADFFEQNEDWLEKSALIALKILRHLRTNKITQKELAESINVSPQYINKIVKGNENLTLETICKIENVLGLSLIEVSSKEESEKLSYLPAYQYLRKVSLVGNTFPILHFNLHDEEDYKSFWIYSGLNKNIKPDFSDFSKSCIIMKGNQKKIKDFIVPWEESKVIESYEG